MTHNFISAKKFVSTIKETVYLFKNIWREGTTTLLHAPRETDKTATALSIASDLAAKGREVLYVNAEDRLVGRSIDDSDNLYIFTPEYESIYDTTDYADLVFEAIEQAVRTTNIRTFVVDSVSRIAALSFGKNASPAYVMKRLVALQIRCKLSILVVANDTTKAANNAFLTLASSEITIKEEENPQTNQPVVGSRPAATAEKSDSSEMSDLSEKTPAATAETPCQSAVAINRDPTPTRDPFENISRQQRRSLKRRIAKHPERYIF